MSGITEVSGIFGQNSLSFSLRPALLPCRTNSVNFDTAEKRHLNHLSNFCRKFDRLRRTCDRNAAPIQTSNNSLDESNAYITIMYEHFQPYWVRMPLSCRSNLKINVAQLNSTSKLKVELMSNAIQLSLTRQKCDVWIGHKTLRIFEQIRTLNCLRITYLH